MNTIAQILEYIISRALEMNRLYIPDESAGINYSAIFCQNDSEFERLNKEAAQIGGIIENTPTGPLYKFHNSFQTLAGPLWLLKIRKPDPARSQRGDADFTLKNYNLFKEKHLPDREHFKIIDRGHFEMIELRDQKFQVLSYFSNIPLTIQLGIER
ncbi:hypothetical protein COX21_01230 [Candidatus Falkowbacteria bacterium CG23_combo_of_CG06-09_8_20_14_all_41_10]|uniref:Uncharacterized protein n=1 Tax=Candidatus Falkowbacteria bacterium CG23_combo_of_CG06-09_8_20_14_all_41_10 TaxID=1974571 RepID=A0A2G9ZQ92_9BACT|nr:MAG: hypothetical protein COX21_01230 [Candidatus Falkowbacteria bacterium CG23_combo_of_CG06-09_8_20_14_all_41_10]